MRKSTMYLIVLVLVLFTIFMFSCNNNLFVPENIYGNAYVNKVPWSTYTLESVGGPCLQYHCYIDMSTKHGRFVYESDFEKVEVDEMIPDPDNGQNGYGRYHGWGDDGILYKLVFPPNDFFIVIIASEKGVITVTKECLIALGGFKYVRKYLQL